MVDDELLQTLQELETELHREAIRRNISCMQALLHDDFEEIGQSGRTYSRKDVLAKCTSEDFELSPMVFYSFALTRLCGKRALLTYVSEHLDESGHPYRHTLRSSLWVFTKEGWQMRFHRGTPTHAFSKIASAQRAAGRRTVKRSQGAGVVKFGLPHRGKGNYKS